MTGKITKQELHQSVNNELNKIGILSELTTAKKADLVGAINEVNAKEVDLTPIENQLTSHLADYVQQLGTVELSTSDKTLKGAINEVFQTGNNVKSNTVDALLQVDESLPITTNDSWQDVIDAIGSISTGKKWASGTSSTTNNELIVTGLGFTPTVIVIEQMYNDNGAVKVLRQTYLADSPLLEGKSDTYLTQFQWLNKTIVRKQHNSNMPSIENHDALITVGDYSFEAFIARSNELAHWIAFE